MSASILWQPVKPGKSLGVGAPSSFLAAMERALGYQQPWTLTESDTSVLRGLAAGLSNDCEAVEELLEAIEKHGEVRVWAAY